MTEQIADDKAAPFDALPIRFHSGTISVGEHKLLDDVDTKFFPSASEEDGCLVLGLRAATGKPASSQDTGLGALACDRLLVSARIKIYWMTPEWGRRACDIPPETQFLLARLAPQGPYAALLPLIVDGKFRTTLRPPRPGVDLADLLRLRVESGDDMVMAAEFPDCLLVAGGADAYEVVERAVVAAARLSGGARPRASKRLPAFLDDFGWCSWDAFYSRVSAQGVAEGLGALAAEGVAPGFLIIDDGWQTVDADAALRPGDTEAERLAYEAERQVLLGSLAEDSEEGAAGGALANLANEASIVECHAAAAHEDALGPGAKGLKAQTDRAEGCESGAHEAANRGWLAVVLAVPVHFAMRMPGWFVGFLMLLFTKLYAVRSRQRKAARLTPWPLRGGLLRFYNATGDHVRRLHSPAANAKFGAPGANPAALAEHPEGLALVVADLRERFGVRSVLCWHSLYGYWAGIAPDAPAMRPLHARLVMPEPPPGVLDVDPTYAWSSQVLAGVGVAADPGQLFATMHSYLAGAGVDGVKVDCQSTLDMIGSGHPGLGGGAALAGRYHVALEDSVARHFPGNALINCMCHSTNNLYRMRDSAVARSSDDFWPRDPASHTTHVAVNAGNALWLAPLVQPDWDMFHSRHPAAALHAAARVVSGGPVYVSDRPGAHDAALLRRLTLRDGTVLRCTQPGRPTLDCLFADPMRDGRNLLKVWATNSCTALVGVFHVQGAHWSRDLRRFVTHDPAPPPLNTRVEPADVPSLAGLAKAGTRFALWSEAAQRCMVVGLGGSLDVRLEHATAELVTVSRVLEAGGVSIAPLGLINMLNTGGAVQNFSMRPAPASTGRRLAAEVRVRGAGTLAIHLSAAPSEVQLHARLAKYEYRDAEQLLLVGVPDTEGLVSIVRVQA